MKKVIFITMLCAMPLFAGKKKSKKEPLKPRSSSLHPISALESYERIIINNTNKDHVVETTRHRYRVPKTTYLRIIVHPNTHLVTVDNEWVIMLNPYQKEIYLGAAPAHALPKEK